MEAKKGADARFALQKIAHLVVDGRSVYVEHYDIEHYAKHEDAIQQVVYRFLLSRWVVTTDIALQTELVKSKHDVFHNLPSAFVNCGNLSAWVHEVRVSSV